MNAPAIIKPSIGRVVWFHPDQNSAVPSFSRHGNDEPYAAIIAHVHSDMLVNLTVFDANGTAHSRTSVELVQDGGSAPGNGYYCEWMPYQKGQAAKTEAAEKTSAAPAGAEYHNPTQREQLECALVSGAAVYLSANSNEAGRIADGIKKVLDELHPMPVQNNPHTGAPRDPRDVASDPKAILCVKPGEPLKAAPITLPVVDPGPDSLEREIQAKAYADGSTATGVAPLPELSPLEQEIQAKANSAPRVTPSDIEAEIASVHFFVASDAIQHENAVHEHGEAGWYLGATQQLTFCVIQLRNGFTVTGESACASPENFNAEIGRRIARENAINKVWPLLGFRLRDQLAHAKALAAA